MKIALVSAFYSEGMGYTENCLPKFLARLGHEVHVLTSDMNIYGNSAEYDATYSSFLGPPKQPAGISNVDGYTLHRLPSRLLAGYVYFGGLPKKLKQLAPEIVHSIEIASLQTLVLSTLKPLMRFRLFTETHQHMSIVKPFLKTTNGRFFQRAVYRMTRTLPTRLASFTVEKCYAISPDCAYVAEHFYGVPRAKIEIRSLGSDTDLFRPPVDAADSERREVIRKQLGYGEEDIISVYTGRFSKDKNPLLLAEAIDNLSRRDPRFHGLFVGAGAQSDAIRGCRNTKVLPFMTHRRLADVYFAADLAVWPTQESMSMLDAASSGLPLITSNRIGDHERVRGNGKVFEEGNVEALKDVLASFAARSERQRYGDAGRASMLKNFSWTSAAKSMEADYLTALRTTSAARLKRYP